MPEKNLITLCILTYNRNESVSLLVTDLVEKEVNKIANILIIDDGSEDETFIKLKEFRTQKNISLLRNEENQGFANTFIRCLREAPTEYLAICTDDEIITHEGLLELHDLIRSSAPDFISTKFKSRYAGRGHSKTALLNFPDIWNAARHIPGLIFKKSSSLSLVEMVQDKLDSKNAIAFFFPQIYLLLLMQASEMKLFKSTIVISAKNTKGSQPSQLINSSGQSYAGLSTVIERFTAFTEIYLSLIEDPNYHKAHPEIRLLLKKHERSFFKIVESAIYFENPDLLRVFRKSLFLRIFNFKLTYRTLKEKLKF
jgi:glycosyltransferase involved in cell wall biosynthesis